MKKNTCVTKWDSVIFDMDGVLIDVSQSYNQSIKHTVEHVLRVNFDITAIITQNDIAKVRAIPGFNNDWDLSYTLIQLFSKCAHLTAGQDQRVMVPTTKVQNSYEYLFIKDVFQSFYLGNSLFKKIYGRDAPISYKKGLINNEQLLINVSVLQKLTKVYQLAIATGRPRYEALFTLQYFGITPKYILEKNVVALEDSPKMKPSPDPLLKAQQCLAAHSSVYVGDTINDVLAAKKAMMSCIFVGRNDTAEYEIDNINEILQILMK